MKLIEPDINFIEKLSKDSGAPLKQCMQCGTCSVICKLSPEENPFPRKEMIWAGWGLKNKLLGDPDIWLCHQCGDCTTYCPRGVKPGDVLSSLRFMSYLHYSKPKFLTSFLSKFQNLPFVIFIPIIIIFTIIYFSTDFQIPSGEINYSKFFPHKQLNISFSILVLLTLVGITISIKSFWKDLKKNMPPKETKNKIFKSFVSAFMEILSHKKFKKCDNNNYRYSAHLMVFYGFITLLFVTFFAILSVLFFEYPLLFFNPIKIAGNLAAISLLTGLSIMIIKRFTNKELAGNSTYFDWIFLISLYLLVITGVLVEIARFDSWKFAYYIYFVHLVLVWMVIIYLPYTKFGHMIYRITALTYCKFIKRG